MEDKKFIAQILKEGLQPINVNSDVEINHLYESLKKNLKTSIKGLIGEDEKKDSDEKNSKKFSKWYTDVQNDLNKEKKPTAPSQAGVIRILNPNYDNLSPSEQATERSLFRKKLNKETNDEGGQYLFSIEELAKIRSILGIG